MLYKRTQGALKSPNDSRKDRGGLPRAGALTPHRREMSQCTGPGSSLCHISISSPVAGVAGEPGPRAGKPQVRRDAFFISVHIGANGAMSDEPPRNTATDWRERNDSTSSQE
jgi:hypothetical protein